MIQLNLLLKGMCRINQHFVKKAMPITPEILKDIYRFLKFENSFDVVIVALFLLMFFLMTRKSNMVPMSVSTII